MSLVYNGMSTCPSVWATTTAIQLHEEKYRNAARLTYVVVQHAGTLKAAQVKELAHTACAMHDLLTEGGRRKVKLIHREDPQNWWHNSLDLRIPYRGDMRPRGPMDCSLQHVVEQHARMGPTVTQRTLRPLEVVRGIPSSARTSLEARAGAHTPVRDEAAGGRPSNDALQLPAEGDRPEEDTTAVLLASAEAFCDAYKLFNKTRSTRSQRSRQQAVRLTVPASAEARSGSAAVAGDRTNDDIYHTAMENVYRASKAHRRLLEQQQGGQAVAKVHLEETKDAVTASARTAMLEIIISMNSRPKFLRRLSCQALHAMQELDLEERVPVYDLHGLDPNWGMVEMFFDAMLEHDLGVCGCALLIPRRGKHTETGESDLRQEVIKIAEKCNLVVTLYSLEPGVVGVCTPQVAAIVAQIRSELGDPSRREYTPADNIERGLYISEDARRAHREAAALRAQNTPAPASAPNPPSCNPLSSARATRLDVTVGRALRGQCRVVSGGVPQQQVPPSYVFRGVERMYPPEGAVVAEPCHCMECAGLYLDFADPPPLRYEPAGLTYNAPGSQYAQHAAAVLAWNVPRGQGGSRNEGAHEGLTVQRGYSRRAPAQQGGSYTMATSDWLQMLAHFGTCKKARCY
ncbi:hypothetical protein JKP88DRAFT_243176 [Tribonema minus]|uniref:Uncharacterized protein n=1 Tax=Tribonema minus TaxID=303371 RepID=A0A835ZAQ8_9STRA|nr:hypothetical protein JKP88DRAFT_243176 [Tribonema minus]